MWPRKKTGRLHGNENPEVAPSRTDKGRSNYEQQWCPPWLEKGEQRSSSQETWSFPKHGDGQVERCLPTHSPFPSLFSVCGYALWPILSVGVLLLTLCLPIDGLHRDCHQVKAFATLWAIKACLRGRLGFEPLRKRPVSSTCWSGAVGQGTDVGFVTVNTAESTLWSH